MHADPLDAAPRISRRKPTLGVPVLLGLLAGLSLPALGLYLAAEAFQPWTSIAPATHAPFKLETASSSGRIQRAPLVHTPSPPLLQPGNGEPTGRPPEHWPRQTEFNASNYQPRGAVNSLPAPAASRQHPVTAEHGNRLQVRGIREAWRLRDACPFAEGSLAQRDCRRQIDLSQRGQPW